jgi:hypothetical protein
VGGDVVGAVVVAGEDEVSLLQPPHPPRKTKVRVGPLVDLWGGQRNDQSCLVTIAIGQYWSIMTGHYWSILVNRQS